LTVQPGAGHFPWLDVTRTLAAFSADRVEQQFRGHRCPSVRIDHFEAGVRV